LLAILDARLNDFQHVLLRLDPRRGLLELGGLVLKQMFRRQSYLTLSKLPCRRRFLLINLVDILWILNTLRYNTSEEVTWFLLKQTIEAVIKVASRYVQLQQPHTIRRH